MQCDGFLNPIALLVDEFKTYALPLEQIRNPDDAFAAVVRGVRRQRRSQKQNRRIHCQQALVRACYPTWAHRVFVMRGNRGGHWAQGGYRMRRV